MKKRASPGIEERKNDESHIEKKIKQNLYHHSNDKRCYRGMFQHELASARQLYSIRNYKRVLKCRGAAIGLLGGIINLKSA